MRKTGTSFAAPLVSGYAACIMEWGIVNRNDENMYGEKLIAYITKYADGVNGEELPGKRQGSFRIEKKITEKSKGSSHTDINHRMLLQEHSGHNNKHCKNKRNNSYVLLSTKGLAIGQ